MIDGFTRIAKIHNSNDDDDDDDDVEKTTRTPTAFGSIAVVQLNVWVRRHQKFELAPRTLEFSSGVRGVSRRATEPNRTEPNRTEPNRTEPNRPTESTRIEPNRPTESTRIEPNRALASGLLYLFITPAWNCTSGVYVTTFTPTRENIARAAA